MVREKIFQKKSQTFSADLFVVVIVILIGVLFLVINKINTNEVVNTEEIEKEAEKEADLIFKTFEEKNILNENGDLDIISIKNLDYEKLKEDLNIKGDFAIVLEKDGKLVKFSPNEDQTCFGSDKIIVNGKPCKT